MSSLTTRARVLRAACVAVALGAGAGTLAGCSLVEFPPQVRGNRIDADTLKELVPGTSTRADAVALVGSPTAHATFDDNTWIYIGEVTQPRIGRIQAEISQDVVLLTFNEAGVLQGIKHLNKDDAKPVDVVSRTTPSPGGEASFMQQLLGNVGRFSAGGLGAAGTPGGSAGPPTGGAPQ